MVDLGGYVIIIVETKDKRIKLYGSPADKEDLEVGDEILEVNGRSLENATHTQVISHIHQCIRSRTICLRVKRRNKLALDLTTQHNNIQDAFVVAVEQQARDRLEKLSQLKKIKPVDMTMLSHQLSEIPAGHELNGLIQEVTGSPIYITSVPELNQQQHNELKSPEKSLRGSPIAPTSVHREMAVDVPDNFIPKAKTQPCYPTPIPAAIPGPAPTPITAAVAVERRISLKDEPKPRIGAAVAGASASASFSAKPEESSVPPLPFVPLDITQLLVNLQKSELISRNGYSSNADFAAIHKLISKPEFQRVLQIYNKIYSMCCLNTLPQPVPVNIQDVMSETLHQLYNSPNELNSELVNLFSHFETLLYAYDRIVEREKLLVLPQYGESIDEMIKRSTVVDSPLQPIMDEDDIKIVRIEKTQGPLGATVRNEGDAVLIGRIIKGGTAEKFGLTEGDEILEVNGIEMKGKSINDVCDTLSHMMGTLTFLIVPSRRSAVAGGIMQPPREPEPPLVIHLRAQFNYNPKEDIYLPCHELGIEFGKGDILHVINQNDLNWWQAHRDGEEEQLAGLIPSRVFQEQRQMMKQNIVEMEKKSSSSNLLCAKAGRKRKSRELEDEHLPTYEQVVLLYPSLTKRPVVLIGPPNIGRHELRQRLIQEYPDRFGAAVPHTSRPQKENEIDGQDYFFISRTQFEADIAAGKFIEYGEFEKAYYGTSIENIKSIMTTRTCVLNLHPQSIEVIRARGDLKPYIVFIGPASLERLKELRLIRGEAFKEDELIDIIRSANRMEAKYGHYFDYVIVNNDLEVTYYELITHINYLETRPQWVPAFWSGVE